MATMQQNVTFCHVAAETDWSIPSELLTRLYGSAAHAVADLVSALSSRQRAQLAMFCYSRTHFREAGLAVAATCDLTALLNAAPSNSAGECLYAQSRGRAQPLEPEPVRPAISLATAATSNALLSKILAETSRAELQFAEAE